MARSNGLKVNIYVGSDAVGIFIETSFDPKFSFGVDIRSKTQQKVRIFALLAARTPFKPGVFLGVHLDARLARALDKFVRQFPCFLEGVVLIPLAKLFACPA